METYMFRVPWPSFSGLDQFPVQISTNLRKLLSRNQSEAAFIWCHHIDFLQSISIFNLQNANVFKKKKINHFHQNFQIQTTKSYFVFQIPGIVYKSRREK